MTRLCFNSIYDNDGIVPAFVSDLKLRHAKPIHGLCEHVKSQFSQPFTLIFCKMSHAMRKPAFCICENKDPDQLRGNREADQRLCFRYMDNTIPLLPKSEISSL